MVVAQTRSTRDYRLFNAEEFSRMIERGLVPKSGVELVRGLVLDRRVVADGELPLHRFTRRDYYRMAELGILGPNERLELTEGTVVKMSPIGPYHADVVGVLARLFMPLEPRQAMLRIQSPLHLETDEEPEPDLMLLRPRADRYRKSHPRPAEVLLLIEASDTTFHTDTGEKLEKYARAKVPEYWIVDVKGRRVLVHRDPLVDDYQSRSEAGAADRLAPAAFPDFPIDLAEVFGPL